MRLVLLAALGALLSTRPGEAIAAPAAKPGAEAGDGGAMVAFQKRQDSVLKLVRAKAGAAKLQKEVDALLDYRWVAEAALGGPRFEKRCAPRCDEFEKLLASLIRENYLKRIRTADRGRIEYVDEQRRPAASKVTTRVTFQQNGQDQTLEIAYVMHQVEGTWQVRDIITDGVSLARNYKFEFNKILREQGIDGLIQRLQTKLAELGSAAH
jgi:phospholipid transport system substrate-binding protein